MSLNIIKGDLFKHLPSAKDKKILIPQCNNDIGGWGSGFVVAVSKYNKNPELAYREWASSKDWREDTNQQEQCKSSPNFALGECQVVKCSDNVYVANMIGQHKTISHGEKVPVRYWALAKCMRFVAEIREKLNIDEIWTVRFGSNLARGRQDFIETLINEIWVNEGIPTTIYEL